MPSKKACSRSEVTARTRENHTFSTRRRILAVSGITIGGVLAGCTDIVGNDPAPEAYERLQQRPVYVEASVDLSTPDAIRIVDSPDAAHLIVIPDRPDIEASQAVEWLEQKRAIALLGEKAQSTWLSWTQSDAYVEAFDPEGIAEGDPDPELLIAWDSGPVVTTAQYNWGSGATDSDVLSALDETLEKIEPREG